MALAYIGLGANLPSTAGSPEATMAAAAQRLAGLGRVVSCSSLYSTAPVGFDDQPRFVNAAVGLETDRSPRELLEALLMIEREFGRDRSAGIANGPRTLDLDILLYDGLVLRAYDLEIPHPRMVERAFVLVPLSEIAPELRDPRTGATMQQLLETFSHGNPSQRARGNVVQVEGHAWDAVARGLRAASASSPRPGSDTDFGHS
ncbi:MAG TPA: 2-amino-4-hydroxy-6-hydroxymethyldihydropteridine diphosphokinase [Terracidiphilus sp.]|nr:2-amino-4-hydroxy-6-hydroxymethyldihydropteridine diphosphokinase [Terracidiphilus sp.]